MASQTKTLSAELIMFKTKTNQLDRIKNLNLCANDLADISIVSQMTSLEVLSVSVNSITTLEAVGQCLNLKELYIRRNSVEALSEIDYLAPLKQLKIMWLAENPVATRQGYRQYVLRQLPQLEKLDNVEVTEEERSALSSQTTSADEQPHLQQSSEKNSFAAAAARKRTGIDNSSVSPSHGNQDSARAGAGVGAAQFQIGENPNSTNPYFQNKMRSPELAQKQRGQGFAARNELRNSPMLDLDQAKGSDEKYPDGQPPLEKQKTKIAQVRRNIRDPQPEKYDLGNNFIRKGSGLPRTPTRPDDMNSQENSPEAGIQMRNMGQQRNKDEANSSPITWPSSKDAVDDYSPVARSTPQAQHQSVKTSDTKKSARDLADQVSQAQAQKYHQPDSLAELHGENSKQQKQRLLQHGEMQGRQSSPTMMVPRQIRSPKKAPTQPPMGLQQQLGSQPAMPQIAIPPGLNGNQHQLQQLLQLNQLLLQQQNLGAVGQLPMIASSPAGFSGLVQQQTQQLAAQQQQHKRQENGSDSSKQAAQKGHQKKQSRAGQGSSANEHPYRRDENILCAILALLKELDKNGLEFVVKDCNKRIAKMDNFQ